MFGKPTGIWGKIGGKIMAKSNSEINYWTVSLLNIQNDDRVLEIGFGPGIAIQHMSKIISNGMVAGIDCQEVMLKQAKRRNAQAIKEGRVDLRLAEVSNIPLFQTEFDKVISINSIIFWQHPIHQLQQIRKLMKLGGLIALTVQPRMKGATNETTEKIGNELMRYLNKAGFSNIKLETKHLQPVNAVCAIGVNEYA
jgi:ubiquinone/menaquinone biosynthesis C-methylase UbiE